jgi:hypothetical protein
MIAYNKIWLDNVAAREVVEDAFYANLITREEKQQAETALPVGFYSPNYFIRAGLFILTIIAACFSVGLLSLLFLSGIEEYFGGLLFFFALLAYAVLEFFVRIKHHYKSGVDDALLWITGICIFAGLNIFSDISATANALIVFTLATYFSLRFADMFMSGIAGIALLAVIFLIYIKFGSIAELTAPFVLMAVAAAIYFGVKKVKYQNSARHYLLCCVILEIVMLVCFYAVGNYFVVQQASEMMFDITFINPAQIHFGWFFWIFTICIPLIYIALGVQKKESVLIRVGLLLITAIVFTVRNYYAVLPIETVMLMGGIILIVIAYALTKYLAQPKNGFTAAEISNTLLKDEMNIEGLIIAETFAAKETEARSLFGGGSFGGGGASGDF